jgi:hypothetical protein
VLVGHRETATVVVRLSGIYTACLGKCPFMGRIVDLLGDHSFPVSIEHRLSSCLSEERATTSRSGRWCVAVGNRSTNFEAFSQLHIPMITSELTNVFMINRNALEERHLFMYKRKASKTNWFYFEIVY